LKRFIYNLSQKATEPKVEQAFRLLVLATFQSPVHLAKNIRRLPGALSIHPFIHQSNNPFISCGFGV